MVKTPGTRNVGHPVSENTGLKIPTMDLAGKTHGKSQVNQIGFKTLVPFCSHQNSRDLLYVHPTKRKITGFKIRPQTDFPLKFASDEG